MSDLRTREKNNISKEMQDLDKRIEYHVRRATNIQSSSFSDQYIQSCMSKSDEQIKNLRDQKVRLMKRYSDINAGLLDFEIQNEYRKRTEEINDSGNEKIIKKIKNAEQDRKYLQKLKNMDRISKKEHNKHHYSIQNEYRKFERNSNATPPFIMRELNRMPNNHGYIWRGIHYYGKLEETGGNIILTEPMKGYSIIHETDINTRQKTMYKKQKGKQTVIIQ